MGIVDEAGTLCGAGVLVCADLVLTCAHVIDDRITGDPEALIGIRFVGAPTLPDGVAHVQHCVPVDGNDHSGDIALLRLTAPVPEDVPVRPRLMRLHGRPVRAHGYPDGTVDTAVWAEAKVVASTGPRDEWLQMVPLSGNSVEVDKGFSGAGVVDNATGAVVGIVVAAMRAGGKHVSCMIPVETIMRYASAIESCVEGTPPTDAIFDIADTRITDLLSVNRPAEAGNTVVDAVRRLVEALGEAGRTGVWNVVGPAADRAAALGILVFLADPTSRRLATETVAVPADLVLPPGRIDLAVDARGLHTADVARRILERLGLPVDEPDLIGRAVAAGAGLTIVVDGVDEAAEPDSLLHELLRPIAGGLLIVGSGQPVLAEPAAVLAVGPGPGLPVRHRLDELDATLAEIDASARLARERFTNDGTPKFRSAPTVAGPDDRLRLRVTGLRSASAGREDDPRLPGMLTALERSAARALRRAKLAFDQLDAMLATRNELRGTLDAYQARAGAARAEDPRLTRLYRLAYDHLYTAPCDLTAARAAVDAYLAAVRGPDPAEEG